MKTQIAVVGLGAMGAATLYQLARRGMSVVGIDRFAPPHSFGSSHGETRITRQAVGEGSAYVPLVRRSHEIWHELENATNERLLVTCGAVMIGPLKSAAMHHYKPDFLRNTMAVAQRFGIAHALLDKNQLLLRFPQFAGLHDGDVAYYEPYGGFLFPEACVRVQLTEARRLGARLLTDTRVHSLTQHSDTVSIETDSETIEARQAVVAIGAWAGPLLGAPFNQLLRVTRQVQHWFVPADAALYDEARCPVYIQLYGQDASDYFYGFPTPTGSVGVKIATETGDTTATADSVNRTASPAEAQEMYRRHLAGRMAGLTERVLRRRAAF